MPCCVPEGIPCNAIVVVVMGKVMGQKKNSAANQRATFTAAAKKTQTKCVCYGASLYLTAGLINNAHASLTTRVPLKRER